MHVISISTNLQRRDPVVQTEPFHTEGKDMKSTQEMAPTSQHQIFSHNSRKRKKWMDAYRSAPRAGAGHRSTRGQGRGGRGCGPWCHHSSSSRTPCGRPDRQRTKSEAAGLESRIRREESKRGARFVPGSGAGRWGLAEEDADLLHAPRQARPPCHRCRLLAFYWILLAAAGFLSAVLGEMEAARWNGPGWACAIGSLGSLDRHRIHAVRSPIGGLRGRMYLVLSMLPVISLKKAKFQQKYEW